MLKTCYDVLLDCVSVNNPQKVEPYLGLGLLATKSITEVRVGGTEAKAPQTLKKMPSLALSRCTAEFSLAWDVTPGNNNAPYCE